MKLGIDVFSLRFNEWDAFGYLDYAKSIGLEVVMFPDPDFFESLDDDYLGRVKSYADDLGLELEVGMYSCCSTSTSFSDRRGTAVEQLRTMLHVAEVLGSKVMRTLLGSNADRRTETPLSTHIANTISALQAVRDQAMDLGIKIAVENHAGDLLGSELKALVEEAGPAFVGVCIDSGNPLWMGESPYVTLDHLAPYVVMSHIRDTAISPHPKGAVVQWVAMGEGSTDIARWSKRYQEQCPNTNFTLEIIASLPPKVLNYLEPEYWSAYCAMPAAEFAQFLQLVHSGTPYTQPLLTASWANLSPAAKVAIAEEQCVQVEKSVRYCREVLGIGK
ncbi:MAG TPA: sugar phosphate isomerase/epimerase family protein [Caldilineaceae bacterium]|nr:sugar phosphate isomerase/epimerase family protein [Caldilineaceae bacterium]